MGRGFGPGPGFRCNRSPRLLGLEKQWRGIHLNSNVSSAPLLGESAHEAQRGSGLGCAWPGGQSARPQVTFGKWAKGTDGDKGFEDTQ